MITNRLVQLASLKNGWLNGEGVSPSPEQLFKFGKIFLHEYDPGLPKPYFYPTCQGGLIVEWDINDWMVSLEINLETDNAQFDAIRKDSDDTLERQMNINSLSDWVLLNLLLWKMKNEN
jgi:hypothetical protein